MIDVDTGLRELTDLLRFTAGHVESDSRMVERMYQRDLGHAAYLLEQLIYRRGPALQLTVGENPIDAYVMHKLPYDFTEARKEEATPGTVENLRFIRRIPLDIFDRSLHPVYGHIQYFGLNAMGKTLREGGSLTIPE